MRASLTSPSQNSSGSNSNRFGSNPRKAASKAGHLLSMTLQTKPAQKIRLVISASTRWSSRLLNTAGLDTW